MNHSLNADLGVAVDRALTQMGYTLAGDDDAGWCWRFGELTSSYKAPMTHDSHAQACAAALQDLSERLGELVDSANRLTAGWRLRDIADAVRQLVANAGALDPQRRPGETPELSAERCRQRLRSLVEGGLLFTDCIDAFGVDSRTDPLAREAVRVHRNEGCIEFDDVTVVSESDHGAYVMAWAWVDKPLVSKPVASLPDGTESGS